MGSKKHASRVAANVSSAKSLSASTTTHQTNASVIHKAAFAPSIFQLSLFASVIQGLNGHQLRVHDTVSGRLQCQHDAHTTRITCLDWGYYGDPIHRGEHLVSKKKKRRTEETNGVRGGPGDCVLAYGTSQSEIEIFSPARAKVVAILKGGHTSTIKDFKFVNHGFEGRGWSIGSDRKLVQWNLRDQTTLRSIESPATPPSTLLPFPSAILVASHDTWLIDLSSSDTKEPSIRVGDGANPICSIYANMSLDSDSKPQQFLTFGQSEQQVLVYDISDLSAGKNASVLTLNATGDIEMLAMPEAPAQDVSRPSANPQVLAAVTKRGELELFAEPFDFGNLVNGVSDRKSTLKKRTRRPQATITVAYHGSESTPLPLAGAAFHDDDLVVAFVEGGGQVSFERIQWRDPETGGLSLDRETVLRRSKSVIGAEAVKKVGAKRIGLTQVDESHATFPFQASEEAEPMAIDKLETITISSGEEEESDSDEEPYPNGQGSKMNDEAEPDLEDEDVMDASDTEPTFGDLIRTHGADPVDVAATASQHDQSVIPYGQDASKTSTGLTLSNVLSQALRTNDVSLLESCFHEQDLNVVRATIERLDATLATALLQKLAEKMHSRPGRAGSLMIWIQWTLVSHGGFLASQPDIVKRLAALQRVVKERASSLQPLLNLKGKLDMLEAQMNLRRSMLSRARRESPQSDGDEQDVIYVEGQENMDIATNSTKGQEDGYEEDGIEGHNISSDSDAKESDLSEEDLDDLIDDEASEGDTSEEEDEDDSEVDYEDVDSGEDASDDEAAFGSGKSKLPNGIR